MTPQRQRLELAAIKLINMYGIVNVGLTEVCEEADIPPGSFAHHAGETFTEFMRGFVESDTLGPVAVCGSSRVDPEIMRAHLVNVALNMALNECTWWTITSSELAARAGTNSANVYRLFKGFNALRDAIRDLAIKREQVEQLKETALQYLEAKI